MRALVLSDIHNNIENIRRLRESERNDFDAILVAGDIGDETAQEFYSIMDSFECPTYCVYGNWDSEQPYRSRLSKNCRLIHHSIARVGGFYVTGFSGCPTSWGQNPIFLEEKRKLGARDVKTYDPTTFKRTLVRNREQLFSRIRKSKISHTKLIVMTHERLSRIAEENVSPLLHIYGHIHKYEFRKFKGTHYLNAAAIDNGYSEGFVAKDAPPEGYCWLTIQNGDVSVERRLVDTKSGYGSP